MKPQLDDNTGKDVKQKVNNPSFSPVEAGGTIFQLKKILVPVDFSSCSRKALEYALPFARQFGAELILLHVMEPLVTLSVPESLPGEIVMTARDVQQGLDEICENLSSDVAVKTLVKTGSPQMEIVDTASELDADLVILSTHGRTGLGHVLMGSTAEKVVRRIACPVLVVREHEHEFIHVEAAAC